MCRKNNLFKLIEKITEKVFVPITLGGGIKSLKDIEKTLYSRADKIAINSGAFKNCNLYVNLNSKKFIVFLNIGRNVLSLKTPLVKLIIMKVNV